MLVLDIVLTGSVLTVMAALIRARPLTLSAALFAVPLTGFGLAFALSAVRSQIFAGYPGDSYWTLQLAGRLGVALIALVAAMGFVLLIAAKTRHLRSRWPTAPMACVADLCLTALTFALGFSLLPQVFYAFYRQIFDGLPAQIVIKSLLDTSRIWQVTTLRPNGSLADHLSGCVFWATLSVTLMVWLFASAPRRRV